MLRDYLSDNRKLNDKIKFKQYKITFDFPI